jgi:hypothetical protein
MPDSPMQSVYIRKDVRFISAQPQLDVMPSPGADGPQLKLPKEEFRVQSDAQLRRDPDMRTNLVDLFLVIIGL